MSDVHTLAQALQSRKIDRRTFVARALALGVSLGGIEAILQSCGGSSSSGGGSAGKANIKWSTWGTPDEMKTVQNFTDQFNKDHPNINAQLALVPSVDTYESKILTQVNGGVAPDLFYLQDFSISKFRQDKVLVDLTPLLNSSKSQSKPDEFISGLWGVAKSSDGRIWGMPNDCNPLIIWYNKTVLQQAGITEMPADLYQQGKWNRDVFLEMVHKIRAKGLYGFTVDNSWGLYIYPWMTTNGGTIYADNGYGNFVADQDSKSVEGLKWLASNIQSQTFTITGALPKGQGADVIFANNRVGFFTGARWNWPTFHATPSLQYDIVVWPPNTGKKIEGAGIAVSYFVINSKTPYQNAAFEFLSNYVSKAGQRYRLKGEGVLPSIHGIDDIVEQDPKNWQAFIDARDNGYALFPAEAGTPGLSQDINKTLDDIWFKNADVATTLHNVAQMANPRIAKAKNDGLL
jgi:multiple sugar transport system substrate-binding protein